MDKALLVGINAYPGAPLEGCVNDVKDMSDLIVKRFGFKPEAIRMLLDARATTDAIKDRLAWLVSDLKPGDRVLFHYSGHGAQVATRDLKGEVDGLDEVICPVDFDWSDERMVRDKDFNKIFSSIPAGVRAFWVSDSCHSGDLQRSLLGLGGRKAKRLLPPDDVAWRLHSPKARRTRDAAAPELNVALISGCRSDQTSADARFGWCRKPNGALTRFLIDRLLQSDGTASPLSRIVPDVLVALKKSNFDQEPQLEGSRMLATHAFLS